MAYGMMPPQSNMMALQPNMTQGYVPYPGQSNYSVQQNHPGVYPNYQNPPTGYQSPYNSYQPNPPPNSGYGGYRQGGYPAGQ